ncbi:MAG: polynucleotide adenylyltransferase PcnB [Deltaproteobacteria bacterium]|nr:polynucleotide adenylyltransferase PcnB [Deltaproteobacteria bacterium]
MAAEASLIELGLEPLVLERPEHPISRRDIDSNVLKVLYRLINADYIAYLVGGGVRDLMLARQPKDFDIATSAHPHQIRELFRNSRLIGRRFRLVHVFFGPINIEVATFRRRGEDDDVDGLLIRHDNTFGTPEEDAFRRDFTINALFYDPRTFRVLDYVGGVHDLSERLIRTIGEPELRMREDPVRMIRAVRLAAKLNFEIEPATERAIECCASDLSRASVPRLVEEIYRTLLLANSASALSLMERLGLLDSTLPMLSGHLKQFHPGLEVAPTVRIMEALGGAIKAGFEPPRGFLLACLLADLYLAREAKSASVYLLQLCHALRARGYSRADTEHMRLLMDALSHMLKPSRITRRLARRPYFPLARRLFELIGPIFSADPAELDRFLTTPPEHHRANRNQPSAHESGDTTPTHQHRRRRSRRIRRGRNRRHHGTSGLGPETPKAEISAGGRAAEASVQAPPADGMLDIKK